MAPSLRTGCAQVVGADLIAPVTVEAETFARRGAVVLRAAHNLDQALETAEKSRTFRSQVDQHFVVQQVVSLEIDDYRRLPGERIVGGAVGHEAGLRCGP